MATLTQKTIYLETNFNNKLACNYFIHISKEPEKPVPESAMENTVFEIRTLDNSYPPALFKLVDLSRVQLTQLNSALTLQSHGKEWFDFVNCFMKEHGIMDHTSRVCIYQYRRHTVDGK